MRTKPERIELCFLCLVWVSIVIFAGTGALKFAGTYAAKVGLLDPSAVRQIPIPLLMGAAAFELGLALFLTRRRIQLEKKLQVLFASAVMFLCFRFLAFGGLIAKTCGCLGGVLPQNATLGKAIDTVLVLFLVSLLASYPMFLICRWWVHRDGSSAGNPDRIGLGRSTEEQAVAEGTQ